MRNEQAAAYMADAYGRLTGRPGVCSSSSGVAHVNALTGVLNAYFDGAPMLLVTGCGDTATLGLGHFQDVDQVALAEPICKYARLIDRVELVPEILFEAWSAAINGRPGPVHITFPQDMMLAEIDPAQADQIPTPPERVAVAGDPLQITEAVKLLQEAQCPLI
ncbi:MAG TPA: acetolactate synthase large subunit, partial [Candidatus Latescibacteria bacterium]|nr:acetolactate synthase large subunit [Candidatus Latescibacterota bacterium]